jgi:hypothetical protein
VWHDRTITHTIGVYVLGALTLVAAQYVLPERLIRILGVLSASWSSRSGCPRPAGSAPAQMS